MEPGTEPLKEEAGGWTRKGHGTAGVARDMGKHTLCGHQAGTRPGQAETLLTAWQRGGVSVRVGRQGAAEAGGMERKRTRVASQGLERAPWGWDT